MATAKRRIVTNCQTYEVVGLARIHNSRSVRVTLRTIGLVVEHEASLVLPRSELKPYKLGSNVLVTIARTK